MRQTTPSSADQPESHAASRTGVSRLAIAALVLAFVPCCPLTGLLGTFLGVLALRRIRLSEGRVGGARLAMAAVAAGAASAFIWAMLAENLARTQQAAQLEAATTQVAELIRASQEGRPDDAAGLWPEGVEPTPTEEEVRAFGEATLGRYGEVARFAITSTTRSGTWLAPVLEVAGVCHFQRSSPLASARFQMRVGPGLLSLDLALVHVVIEDADLGDLSLGVAPDPHPPMTDGS